MVRAWESETGARKDEGKRRLGRIRVSHPIRLGSRQLTPNFPKCQPPTSNFQASHPPSIQVSHSRLKRRNCDTIMTNSANVTKSLKRPSMSNSGTITLAELPACVFGFSKYLELWRRPKEIGKEESMQRLIVRRIRWQ
jgi:hypothetical protein